MSKHTSIEVFNFQEGSQVRTVVQDGEHWFVLRDILAAMGSTTPTSRAAESILDGIGMGVINGHPLKTAGGTQPTTLISEPAVTFLVSRSNTELGKLLNRWIHKEVLPSLRKTGSYTMQQPDPRLPLNVHWMIRTENFDPNGTLPRTHFCVFTETTNTLMWEFERVKYRMPENLLPDGSVGKMWRKHLKEEGYDLDAVSITYQHSYPDGNTYPAYAYAMSLLGDFRTWMYDSYSLQHLPKYLLARDKQALQSLTAMLGVPTESILDTLSKPQRKALTV